MVLQVLMCLQRNGDSNSSIETILSLRNIRKVSFVCKLSEWKEDKYFT